MFVIRFLDITRKSRNFHAFTQAQICFPAAFSCYKTLFNPVVLQAQHFVCRNAFEVIVQTRVGGLPPISKHREELKIQVRFEMGGSPCTSV